MVDDPLPGNIASGGQGGHGITHHSGCAAADDFCYLSVRSHLTYRDSSDYLINLCVAGNVPIFHSFNLFRLAKKCNCFCAEEMNRKDGGVHPRGFAPFAQWILKED